MKAKQFFDNTNKQLVWIGIAMAVLIATCGATPEKMTVKVIASPRISVMTLQGRKVDVAVMVKNPTKLMECVSVAWDYGDGSVAKWEPDCDDPDWHPKLWTEFKIHVYHRVGKIKITVYFYRGHDLYYTDNALIQILGDE